MTGKFTESDPVRCGHYARFMRHLSGTEANIIFFTLFTVVLILLCICSSIHHSSTNLKDLEAGPSSSADEIVERRQLIRRRRVRYMAIVGVCFILSITCVIMEAFAALNIEYCDGEDLMMLYWSFWSVLQVGTIIAEFGVMLQIMILLYNLSTPSWAVALGTPVLVLAAVGHVWDVTLRQLWRKQMSKKNQAAAERGKSPSMSRASTIGQNSSNVSCSASQTDVSKEKASVVSVSLNMDGSLSQSQSVAVTIQTPQGLYQAQGKLTVLTQ